MLPTKRGQEKTLLKGPADPQMLDSPATLSGTEVSNTYWE